MHNSVVSEISQQFVGLQSIRNELFSMFMMNMFVAQKLKYRGFALIEVIVAILIISVSFPIFYAIISQGAGAVMRMRDGLIAQSLVEATFHRVLLNPTQSPARFSRYEPCEASAESLLNDFLPADFNLQSLLIQTEPATYGLHKLTVSIQWKTRGRLLNFAVFGFVKAPEELS